MPTPTRRSKLASRLVWLAVGVAVGVVALVGSQRLTSRSSPRPAQLQRMTEAVGNEESPALSKGQPVDKRADIWAFGCVLYEMLAGRRAFDRADASEPLGAVLLADPDWDALPRETPIAIRRLLRRCLTKDRTRRLADSSDTRQLRDVRPGASFIIEMLLDRAVLSFEWLFDAVSNRRTRITQRIVLSGDNAGAYVDQVRAGFGSTLPDSMKRIADALVRAERSTEHNDR